ncbi:MAG TPA: hypothetical protein VGV61_08410, partial [Thermoanaerobaculia bacterium]|nr:hypothetical protein [Thermoanaerobaculia bacterium]
DRGQGSASKLINDPLIYDAVNDIVVGVKESKLLRWLIRNRQKKGIETRYNATVGAQGGNAKTAADEPVPAASPTGEPAAPEAVRAPESAAAPEPTAEPANGPAAPAATPTPPPPGRGP